MLTVLDPHAPVAFTGAVVLICRLMYRCCCLGSLFLCAELSQGLHVQCGVAEWVGYVV
jgi:hypothetical protein